MLTDDLQQRNAGNEQKDTNKPGGGEGGHFISARIMTGASFQEL